MSTDELNRTEDDEHDLFFLQCLYQAGVDNWEGYSYAQELYKQFFPVDYEAE